MDATYFNSLMIGVTLIAVTVGIIGLEVGFFYFLHQTSKKISSSERGEIAFISRVAQEMQDVFRRIPPSENPGREMALRRDELLVKLRANEISRSEAVELNDILVEERRAAQERNDGVALVAIILGLALLASILARR